MSAESIRSVTLAIDQRLKAALAAAGSSATSYVGPLDERQAASAALILFLYRVNPGMSLRNAEHRVSGPNPGDPDIVYKNSLALDLHYLLTVGPRADAGEPESLRILGYAMQALNDSALLVGSQVAGETVRLTLDTVSAEEMGRIWALFPTVNYRTSVLYMASPVWIDAASLPAQAAATVGQSTSTGQG